MTAGSKLLCAFAFQSILGWAYEWFGRSFEASNQAFAYIGNIIPKAIWYSAFFRARGMHALAENIAPIYGFCFTIFSISLLWPLGSWFIAHMRHDPVDPLGLPQERRGRLRTDIRLSAAGLFAVAIFDFVGLGEPHYARLAVELPNGAGVIGAPIFGFPALFAATTWLILLYRARALAFSPLAVSKE